MYIWIKKEYKNEKNSKKKYKNKVIIMYTYNNIDIKYL